MARLLLVEDTQQVGYEEDQQYRPQSNARSPAMSPAAMTVNPPPPPKTNSKTRISSNMRILSERNGDVTRLTPFSSVQSKPRETTKTLGRSPLQRKSGEMVGKGANLSQTRRDMTDFRRVFDCGAD